MGVLLCFLESFMCMCLEWLYDLGFMCFIGMCVLLMWLWLWVG